MARLGRRERAALRERDSLERDANSAVATRIAALTDLTPIYTSWMDPWPIGKPCLQWGYTGTTAGRIHRKKG